MLLAGETPNILLLTGISKIDIFLIKKKKNLVGYSNIPDMFASTNLTFNLRNKRKNYLTHTLHNLIFIKNK